MTNAPKGYSLEDGAEFLQFRGRCATGQPGAYYESPNNNPIITQ